MNNPLAYFDPSGHNAEDRINRWVKEGAPDRKNLYALESFRKHLALVESWDEADVDNYTDSEMDAHYEIAREHYDQFTLGLGIFVGARPSVKATRKAPENITRFSDKAAARKAFSGEMQKAANRFFRGATSKSRNLKATELPGGKQRLEFFSPAKNVGYGKRYVQEIDSSGRVIREFKETVGPKGIIETKWVHGGPS